MQKKIKRKLHDLKIESQTQSKFEVKTTFAIGVAYLILNLKFQDHCHP